MLIQYLPQLAQHRIVLASASPRRKELLQQIGLRFEVHVSSFEENLDKSRYTPAHYVLETARHKALDVRLRLQNDAKPPKIIIGADTVRRLAATCQITLQQGLPVTKQWKPAHSCMVACRLSKLTAPRSKSLAMRRMPSRCY